MKSFGVSLALVLVVALASGCGSKGLPVIGRGAVPVPAAERETSEKAVSAFEEGPTISEEIRRLLDEGILGREGEYYTVRVETGATWYYDWTDVFHAVVGKPCFSETPEAENEAAFWAATSQIPSDISPDDFSGILKIPRNCEEAKKWAGEIEAALKQGSGDAWDGWIGKLAESLEMHPEFDFRVEGGEP